MGKKFKLPLEVGFAALCEHIKAIRTTAVQSGTAVAALAESTAASLEEIDGLLGEKQNKSNAFSVTIPTTGWGSDSTAGYPKYYDITVAGMTVTDQASVIIVPASLKAAAACGLCPVCETMAGKLRIRAAKAPTASLTATYYFSKGV